MKRIAFILSILAISSTLVRAQQGFFVFIQSEKQQPFYVRVSENTYNSSSIGYLVIPSLGDSSYHFTVGFPRNQYPEQIFQLQMAGKDHGYQLKSSEAQGWTLFDEASQQSLTAFHDAGKTAMLGERKTGNFVTLMSSLVNDSAVMYRSIVKADLPKPAPVEVASKTDSLSKEMQALVSADSANSKTGQDSNGTAATIAGNKMAAIDPTAGKAVVIPQSDSNRVANTNPVEDSSSVVVANPVGTNHTAGGALAPDSVKAVTKGAVVEAGNPTGNIAVTGVNKPTDNIAVEKPAAAIDSVEVRKKDSAMAKAAFRNSIVKVQESAGATAKQWVFVDSAEAGVDTIDVSIAYEEKPVTSDSHSTAIDSLNPIDSLKNKTAVTEVPVTILPVKTEGTSAISVKTDTATALVNEAGARPDSATATKKPLVIINSDCVNFASDLDVDKLRIKILTANGIEDKISASKKAFRSKCYSTKNIRALSELFASDESRFAFFDTAYPFVSDTSNFKQLLELLSDDLYVARFKALVRM